MRNRLDSLLVALGYAVEPERKTETARRRRDVLDALGAGRISAEEALRLLREAKA